MQPSKIHCCPGCGKLILTYCNKPTINPQKKTSGTSSVKKLSLYWCEAATSKSGSKGLKTVSAQTDQTTVSLYAAGSSGSHKVVLGAGVRNAAPRK